MGVTPTTHDHLNPEHYERSFWKKKTRTHYPRKIATATVWDKMGGNESEGRVTGKAKDRWWGAGDAVELDRVNAPPGSHRPPPAPVAECPEAEAEAAGKSKSAREKKSKHAANGDCKYQRRGGFLVIPWHRRWTPESSKPRIFEPKYRIKPEGRSD